MEECFHPCCPVEGQQSSCAQGWKWEQTAGVSTECLGAGCVLGDTGVWAASPGCLPVLCAGTTVLRPTLRARAAVSCLSHVTDVHAVLAEPSAVLRALQHYSWFMALSCWMAWARKEKLPSSPQTVSTEDFV